MKWLKKVRLINWHYFQDETIEFGKQSVLVGGSGAGKSTIIDALQVILIANHKQIKFNSAAHDETKRSMANYLRGKIGTDQQDFMREGDFTTYILSEFRDDKKKESFVVGAVIDVFRDTSNDSEEFFILADKTIDEIDVIASSGHLRNIEEFKRQFPANRQFIFERNKGNYQKALLSRFGQIHPRFFSTFLKALSFKPIHSVRDFVYDYILDEKELQLDVLKDNFATYEKMKLELENLQERKEKLSGITQTYNQFDSLSTTVIEQEYVVMKLEKLYEEETLTQLEKKFKSKVDSVDILKEKIAQDSIDKNEAVENKDDYFLLFHQDKNQLKKKELEIRIEKLKSKRDNYERRMDFIAIDFRNENIRLGQIVEWVGNYLWTIPKNISNILDDSITVLARLAVIFSDRELTSESERLVLTEELNMLLTCMNQFSTELITYSGKAQDGVKDTQLKINEIQDFIHKLKQKKRTYPSGVDQLKRRLEKNMDTTIPVYIFCEEMEVVDNRWRNAIEGYLHTQRFDLLVEPSNFQKALAIYEEDKIQYKIEGVGLVDTEKQAMLNIVAKDNS